MRFTLRGMLVVLTCAIVVLGGYYSSVTHQRRVVQRMLAAGGSVDYDPEYNHYYVTYVNEESADIPPLPPPSRLRRLLGPDAVENVAGVWLMRYSVSGNSTELIEHRIDDDFLIHIAKLKELRSLSVRFQPITDNGLSKIKCLKHLEELQLYGTKITDSSMITLLTMQSLRFLDLGATDITPSGIERLVQLPQLDTIHVSKEQLAGLGGWDSTHTIFDPNDIHVAVVHTEPGGGGSLHSE